MSEIQKYQTQGIVPAGQDPQRGTSSRQEFGAVENTALAETASTAVAAQAQASVQARYVMAIRRPRDLDDVRVKLLKAAKRPGFAAVARYVKPIGKGVAGPSIRFAEEAARALTNILTETTVVYDDAEKRIVRVSVTDLEANLTYPKDVVIEKVVERSNLRPGQTAIRSRTNSVGRTTYLVEANEDDLAMKEASAVSKAMRAGILRILPGDILEEAMAQVIQTQEREDAADPDAARKKVVDAFTGIGVKPSEIKVYLGHDLEGSSPAELAELRAVFQAIRDGEASWRDAVEMKVGGADESPEKRAESPANAALRAKLAKVQGGAQKPAPAAQKPAVDVPPEEDHEAPPEEARSVPSAEEQERIRAREKAEAGGELLPPERTASGSGRRMR